MKRSLAFVALLTIGLLVAPAAHAATMNGHLAMARAFRLHSMAPSRLSMPILSSASTYSISGTAEDFFGNPLAGYEVDWGWFDPDGDSWSFTASVYHHGGTTNTAGDGTFSLPAVTSDPGHDDLFVFDSDTGSYFLDQWGLDFSTTHSYTLRPGHVAVTVAHGLDGQPIGVTLGDAASSSADTQIDLTQGSGVVNAAPPDFNSGVAYSYNPHDTVSAECEWVNPSHTPVAVTPGTLAGTTVSFDWSQAVLGRLVGPLCQHAGRPGSLVRFAVSNLPAGQQMSFFGSSLSPDDWGTQTYPATVVTSTGTDQSYTVSLRIPKRATVGDVYEIYATRSDDPQSLLELYDDYQVCTFGASRQSIHHGGVVRLRGQTATMEGFTVTLFMTHHRAGEPSHLRAPGWTKVADLYVGSGGKFHSPLLRPSRTTWYAVRFSDEDAGFTAFTPVVRVAVRR